MVLPLVIVELELEGTVLVVRDVENLGCHSDFLVLVADIRVQTAFARTLRNRVNRVLEEEDFLGRWIRPAQNSFLIDATEGRN